MFENQATVQRFNVDADCYATESFNPREVIERNPNLPIEVKEASFTHVEERQIDNNLLAHLTNHLSLDTNATAMIERFRSRRTALSPYLGSNLVCVFIRLPGVHYTIEIDPTSRSVVHWEWQQT